MYAQMFKKSCLELAEKQMPLNVSSFFIINVMLAVFYGESCRKSGIEGVPIESGESVYTGNRIASSNLAVSADYDCQVLTTADCKQKTLLL